MVNLVNQLLYFLFYVNNFIFLMYFSTGTFIF